MIFDSNINSLNQKQNDIQNLVDRFKKDLSTSDFEQPAISSYSNHITRVPWVITCDSWSDKPVPEYIILKPNPRSIRWDFPFRKSIVKTAAGSVSFSWRDKTRGNTVFDEPTLTLTMQSGSLLPVLQTSNTEDRAASVQKNFKISEGHKNFYAFLNLYNVPQKKENGEPNYIRLVMNTMLFPKLIIRGQFVPEDTLSWEETAENMNSIEWQVKFVVNKITPNIGITNLQSLLDLWTSSGGSTGFKVPPNNDPTQTIRNEISEEESALKVRMEEDSKFARTIRNNRTEEITRRVEASETEETIQKAEQVEQIQKAEPEIVEFAAAPKITQQAVIDKMNRNKLPL